MGNVTISTQTTAIHQFDNDELQSFLLDAAIRYIFPDGIQPRGTNVTFELDTTGQLPQLSITVKTQQHEPSKLRNLRGL